MKRKTRKRIALGLAIGLLVGASSAGIYGAYRAMAESTPETSPLTMTIERRDFPLMIQANGELQSAGAVAIAVPPVPVDKLKIAWLIPEGAHVKKGDVLVEFDPEELSLKAREHQSDLKSVNERIGREEMSSEAEKIDVRKDKRIAELEMEKIREFLPRDERIYARRQIIEAQIDRDFAEKRIVFADARLQLKGKIYSLQEAMLLLERGQADARIGQMETALTQLKLISPGSGIIVHNDPGFYMGGSGLTPGKAVYSGMPMFSLVDPEKMEAKCFVLEKDAGELKPEQLVDLTLDPFPGVSFTGKVKGIDKVARAIDRESPVKYFQAIVALDTIDRNLMKPGVKLKAKISAAVLKDALVVPRSAVVRKESTLFAYVQKSPGHFEPVEVSLGSGDVIQVVVQEGLEAGQIVALSPPEIKEYSTGKSKKPAESGTKPRTP